MKSLISLLFASLFLFSGCSKDKNQVFFSSRPITEKTFDFSQTQTNFKKGQKINFVLVKNTEFLSKKIRLQIIQQSDKVDVLGYKLEYANDFEINPKKQFYVNNVHIHNNGFFIFRFFDFADLKKPYAESFVWINN